MRKMHARTSLLTAEERAHCTYLDAVAKVKAAERILARAQSEAVIARASWAREKKKLVDASSTGHVQSTDD